MPRVTWTQNNFNAGEWSPITYGRIDIAKYQNALALCSNYVPVVQGGLTRRPGTRYVAEIKNSANAARLIRFEFSTSQAYVLEFGPSYIRFFTNDGQLMNGGTPYEISTPYAANDLQTLYFTQSADTLYIAHPSYAPRKLLRLGALNWSLATISFLDGPYLLTNGTATTLTPSANTGSVTVTASSTTNINGGSGFQASDVGRVLRIKLGTVWQWGTITAVASTTSITWNIQSTTTGTVGSTVFWRLGAWSSTLGYPSTVLFHQDRLTWGGTTSYPSRIDASNVSDYENMSPTQSDGSVIDSNALSFSLSSQTVNAIRWMVSDEWGMLVGTAGGEWVLAASNQQTAITPTNVTAKQVSTYGVSQVPPVRFGKATLFMQRTLRKLREMSYQYVVGTFQSPDISLLGEHLTKSGIKQLAQVQSPYSILWMCTNDGRLIAFSYDKDQDTSGWHRHSIGGYSDAGQTTAPLIESIASIPSPSVDRDELWIIVNRYINGQTKRYVEVMSKYWEDGDLVTTCNFLDSSAQYSGSPTTTITGLTWLVGQTVGVLADGSVHQDCVVNGSGQITLTRSASTVQVGLRYNSEGKTMQIEAGGADGKAQGKLKRIHRVVFRFFQSLGLKISSAAPGVTTIDEPFRTTSDKMDNPISLFTGDKIWNYEGTYDRQGQIYWLQNDPLPSNILMLSAQLETQDG
jgi:hypothetical protein